MVFEQKDVAIELAKWGVQYNGTYTPQHCEDLYYILIRNYPCMKEGICNQYDNTPVFLIMLGLLLFGLVVGYWIRGKYGKTGNGNSTTQEKPSR